MGLIRDLFGPKKATPTPSARVVYSQPREAPVLRNGYHNGKHYTEYVELMKELWRHRDYSGIDRLMPGVCAAVEATAKSDTALVYYHDYYITALLEQFRFEDAQAVLDQWKSAVYKKDVEPSATTWSLQIERARDDKQDLDDFGSPQCPHCKSPLGEFPNSRKCPSCGHRVIVKKVRHKPIYMTPEQDQARQNRQSR